MTAKVDVTDEVSGKQTKRNKEKKDTKPSEDEVLVASVSDPGRRDMIPGKFYRDKKETENDKQTNSS